MLKKVYLTKNSGDIFRVEISVFAKPTVSLQLANEKLGVDRVQSV
jgi:hypothetical protein